MTALPHSHRSILLAKKQISSQRSFSALLPYLVLETVDALLLFRHKTSDARALSFLFVALSQSQPFSPVGARPVGPAPFPSQPPLSGQSMPMTSPGVLPSGPALFAPASIPASQPPAACPLPVAAPLGFSSAPFSSPMNVGYPQGGPGAPSTKPLPAASLPPPPIGKYCLCHLCVQDAPGCSLL